MMNNKTEAHSLTPIRGSVMIGNRVSISCTHKGKLDVICKHRDGSMARQTWDMKIVPQLNHDLFSFTKAMKEGWQVNWRWKEGGLMIELFKTTRASMKFDRMINIADGNKDTKACRSSTCGYRTWKKYSNVEIPPNNWAHWRASPENHLKTRGSR